MSEEKPIETPPADAQSIFAIQGELPRLPVPTNVQGPLRKLGTSPFPKSGFPALGFLETVYEHIQDRAQGRLPRPASDGPAPSNVIV